MALSNKYIDVDAGSAGASNLVPVGVQPGETILIANNAGSSLSVFQNGINGGATSTLTAGQNLTSTVPVWLQSAGTSAVQITRTSASPLAQPWVPLVTFVATQFTTATAAGTYILGGANKVVLAGAGSAFGTIQLDPAMFTAGDGTANVRLRAWVTSNSVDPAAGAWVFALAPVATYNGGSNVDPGIATLGTNVITASVTPTVSALASATGASATFPAAGTYALAITLASPTAANSVERVGVTLEVQRS